MIIFLIKLAKNERKSMKPSIFAERVVAALKMKGNEEHRKNFILYYRWRKQHPELCYVIIPNIKKGDKRTLDCFAYWDMCGALNGCPTNPHILKMVIEGKMSLQTQLNDWADDIGYATLSGLSAGLEGILELKEAYPWFPDWVWATVAKKAVTVRRTLLDKQKALVGVGGN